MHQGIMSASFCRSCRKLYAEEGPQGLKPNLNPQTLRGPEGPLFHVVQRVSRVVRQVTRGVQEVSRVVQQASRVALKGSCSAGYVNRCAHRSYRKILNCSFLNNLLRFRATLAIFRTTDRGECIESTKDICVTHLAKQMRRVFQSPVFSGDYLAKLDS